MSLNYKGNFLNQLYKTLEKNPKLTIGEALFSFLRKSRLKKHFFYATDEEIYNSIEKFNKEEKEDVEPQLGEKEYAVWVGEKIFKLKEKELEKILTVEEKRKGDEKQGFLFALEQMLIIK